MSHTQISGSEFKESTIFEAAQQLKTVRREFFLIIFHMMTAIREGQGSH